MKLLIVMMVVWNLITFSMKEGQAADKREDSDNSDFRHGSSRNIRRSCGVSPQDSEVKI